MKKGLMFIAVSIAMMTAFSFRGTHSLNPPDAFTGGWSIKTPDGDDVLLLMDGYLTHTTYSKDSKKFIQTRGGTYTVQKNQLTVFYEFNTRNKEEVGQTVTYPADVKNGSLATNMGGVERTWNRLDNGDAPLAGLWAIRARKQNGELQPIHQTGTRKTVKILTGTRFQWAAIDPGTKQFMGTGGGTYTFENGKYTEHIEFFSRDSSRVGSSLSFDGKLEAGDWHHSGLSSRGDPIYEVWSRKK
jgi:hypothetical protein